jgi:hypothetical protein
LAEFAEFAVDRKCKCSDGYENDRTEQRLQNGAHGKSTAFHNMPQKIGVIAEALGGNFCKSIEELIYLTTRLSATFE